MAEEVSNHMKLLHACQHSCLTTADMVCSLWCEPLPSSLCLQALGRRIPFAFLDDIKDKFLAAYGPEAAQYAVAYEYNTEFSSILQQRMRYFVNDPNADAINRVRGDVAEVKNIMVENIEKVQLSASPAYQILLHASL